MDRKLLKECPVCSGVLKVKVLQCFSCNTKIEGDFEPPRSKIFYLPHKDLEFIELFVSLRGNIKEVEKALGVSYPTVRSMLDSVIKKMGYTVKHETDKKIRLEILEKLEKGEISPEKAAQLIKTGIDENIEDESEENHKS